MAFIFDTRALGKRSFTEDEDQFEDQIDKEQGDYQALRDRFFSSKSLPYDDLERLFSMAKARGDSPVVSALKNVVDDPPTDRPAPAPAPAPTPDEEIRDEMMSEAIRAGIRRSRMMEEAKKAAEKKAAGKKEAPEEKDKKPAKKVVEKDKTPAAKAKTAAKKTRSAEEKPEDVDKKEQPEDVDEAEKKLRPCCEVELSQNEKDEIADMFDCFARGYDTDGRFRSWVSAHSEELKDLVAGAPGPRPSDQEGEDLYEYDFAEETLPENVVASAVDTLRGMY